jgi:predicted CopG family antitoxin
VPIQVIWLAGIFSITNEAYSALSKEKRKDESFTEVIIRLTRNRSKLADSFGAWQMSEKEEETIFEKEIPAGWRRSRERLKAMRHEMP